MNDKIQSAAHASSLVDVYWLLVSASEGETRIPIDQILLLCQYMLSSYLSTVPEQREVQVEVLKLLREILPQSQLPD